MNTRSAVYDRQPQIFKWRMTSSCSSHWDEWCIQQQPHFYSSHWYNPLIFQNPASFPCVKTSNHPKTYPDTYLNCPRCCRSRSASSLVELVAVCLLQGGCQLSWEHFVRWLVLFIWLCSPASKVKCWDFWKCYIQTHTIYIRSTL